MMPPIMIKAGADRRKCNSVRVKITFLSRWESRAIVHMPNRGTRRNVLSGWAPQPPGTFKINHIVTILDHGTTIE